MPPLPDGVVAIQGVEVLPVELMDVHQLQGSGPRVVGAVCPDRGEVAMQSLARSAGASTSKQGHWLPVPIACRQEF